MITITVLLTIVIRFEQGATGAPLARPVRRLAGEGGVISIIIVSMCCYYYDIICVYKLHLNLL